MKLISHQYRAQKFSSKKEAELVVKTLYPFVEFMGGRVQAIEITGLNEFEDAQPGDFVVNLDVVMATPSGKRALWQLQDSQDQS